MDDFYITIANEAKCEIKIKASRFIGRTYKIFSIDEIDEQLKHIRKKEYNANHNCYAYIIGTNNNTIFKYSDDGEPNGTAGKPMYDVLHGHSLTNTLVIVTRYFGGTKLGTGGLVRAYGNCVKAVLEKSGSTKVFQTSLLHVTLAFPLYNKLIQIMTKIGAKQIDAQFSDEVVVKIEIRNSLVDKLQNEIIQLSGGKAVIEKLA